MTYWKATVERPDGAGGWAVVIVYGTKDTPGNPSNRHISKDTALGAAKLVLSHLWPVNLAEIIQRTDPDKWIDRYEALTGIADHRITVEVDTSRPWAVEYGQPTPEPLTITVAELRLAEVRAQALALAAAKTKLAELNEQVRKARGDVRHFEFLTEEAAEEATRAGVPEPDVAKARRPPRQPRKKRSER